MKTDKFAYDRMAESNFPALGELGEALRELDRLAGRTVEFKPATTWQCRECGWAGTRPSITDASEVRSDGSIDRVHVAACPDCYAVVRRVK